DLSAPDDAETREFEHAYGRNCHLYSCAYLTPETAALGDLPDPLFGTRFRRALYELATCTLTSDPNYVPSAEEVQKLRQHNWLALWEVWEALSLQDHVFYLAKSYLNFLVRNVENDYLNLYLLALYQKARLRRLSGELQILQTEPSSPLKKAERLRQQFVEFRNHYWFEEASIRPQGNAIYRAYQQGQESRPLYEAVKTELDELEEYYRELTNKRISNAVNVLALLVPLGILSQLFAGFFKFPEQISVSPLWGVVVSVLVIAGTLWLYWYLFRKRIR
ncbi:MAG: hypothetical protein NZM28_11030, partial [Fimbriimonadales bacterium]|nr:hypothetical protein [Fimbriimonadales bacterium]